MWALIFIVAAPSDYNIHSVYKNEQQCIERKQFYDEAFEETNSKMKTRCVLRSRVPENKKSTLVVQKYTIY
jgi:hypothetical protein